MIDFLLSDFLRQYSNAVPYRPGVITFDSIRY